MAHDSTLEHLVEKACRRWEARRRAATTLEPTLAPPAPAFTIALAREVGAGGAAVAQEVGKRLVWPVYDHELLERIAKDSGLRTSLLESVDEKVVNAIAGCVAEFVRELSNAPHVNETVYVHRLIETVLALGHHGECVIVGRGAAFVLPRETTLRVRLVAPLPDRIATLNCQRGLSRQEAAREVRRLDGERTDFIQNAFLKDPRDPAHYDQILNAARFSVEGCAEVIVVALHRRQAEAASRGDKEKPR